MTSGNRNDITQASALIEGYSYEYVIGDKAYDSDALREEIVSAGGVAVIPPRDSRTDPRPYDEALYKRHNIIERFFHRLKQYRRVATRYDKLGTRYLGFVYFAAIVITTNTM
ncbi:transposase [Candidatus Poribacteria bacterium]|nr:transposase [Candidatus Poribacteria bacterium]